MAHLDEHADHVEKQTATDMNSGRNQSFSVRPGANVSGVNSIAIQRLNKMREIYGGDVLVTSGYRDSDYNRSIGGAKNSQHTHGNAFDIRLPKDPAQRQRMVEAAQSAGFTGFGFYGENGHLHIDVGPSRVWGSAPEGLEKHAQMLRERKPLPGLSAISQISDPHERTLAVIRRIESSDGKNLIGAETQYGRAFGAYQMLTSTARDMLRTSNPELARQSDAVISDKLVKDEAFAKQLASQYVRQLEKKYGDRTLVALAYHSGEGNVDNAIAARGDPRKGQISIDQFVNQWKGPAGQKYARDFNTIYDDKTFSPNSSAYASDNSRSRNLGGGFSLGAQMDRERSMAMSNADNIRVAQEGVAKITELMNQQVREARKDFVFNGFNAFGDDNGSAQAGIQSDTANRDGGRGGFGIAGNPIAQPTALNIFGNSAGSDADIQTTVAPNSTSVG